MGPDKSELSAEVTPGDVTANAGRGALVASGPMSSIRKGAKLTTVKNDGGVSVLEFGVEDDIKYYEPEMRKRGIYETEIWSRTEQ